MVSIMHSINEHYRPWIKKYFQNFFYYSNEILSLTIFAKKDLNDDMKVLRVYYAHAICLYGTEREKKEMRLIRERFKDAEIINPANYPDHSMDFYIRLVDKCHIVVFSRLLGKVTSGVGKEVNFALDKDKNVYMLNEVSLFPIKSPVEYIPRQCTIELYEEWYKQRELKFKW